MRDSMKFTPLPLTCNLLKLKSAFFSAAFLSMNWPVNTMLSNKPEIRFWWLPPIVTWWAQTWKVLWDPFPALACVFLPGRNDDESESHLFERPYPLLSSRNHSHMIDPVGLIKFPHFMECFFDGSPRWVLFNFGSTRVLSKRMHERNLSPSSNSSLHKSILSVCKLHSRWNQSYNKILRCPSWWRIHHCALIQR